MNTTSPAERLLHTYPDVKARQVHHELDHPNFEAQKQKNQKRQSEGGAIGVVWLTPTTIVLASRTNLHPGWSLPGGTVEKGEDFAEAFLREIKEETSVEAVIDRLVAVEEKVFISPSGEELTMTLAVFEATALPNQVAITTPEAQKEGLEVRAFNIHNLPTTMILKDSEKLQRIIQERV